MTGLDRLRLSLKMQVMGVVLRIGIKAAIAEAALERDRERVFAEMAREWAAMKAAATD
jgi:DNA invertase Pin-like site-specific DNA recombinase